MRMPRGECDVLRCTQPWRGTSPGGTRRLCREHLPAAASGRKCRAPSLVSVRRGMRSMSLLLPLPAPFIALFALASLLHFLCVSMVSISFERRGGGG